MKFTEMKKGKFYTDGEKVFYKNGKRWIVFCDERKTESDGTTAVLNKGVTIAYAGSKFYEKEIEQVKAGQVFFNGNIKVIDAKTLELLKVTNNAVTDKNAVLLTRFEDIKEKKEMVIETYLSMTKTI